LLTFSPIRSSTYPTFPLYFSHVLFSIQHTPDFSHHSDRTLSPSGQLSTARRCIRSWVSYPDFCTRAQPQNSRIWFPLLLLTMIINFA